MVSIIGNKLQLWLYISPEICMSFISWCDWLRKENKRGVDSKISHLSLKS